MWRAAKGRHGSGERALFVKRAAAGAVSGQSHAAIKRPHLLAHAAVVASAVLCLSAVATPAATAAQPRSSRAAAADSLDRVNLPVLLPKAALQGVAAESATSVWVTGHQAAFCIFEIFYNCGIRSDGTPVVRRWDGAAWRNHPLRGWFGDGHISTVSTGSGETWIAGSRRYVARFDGSEFRPVALPDGVTGVESLNTGPAGTWLATWGATAGSNQLYRRTGDSWTPAQVPAGLRRVTHVNARTADDAWAVGLETAGAEGDRPDVPAAARWDGDSWQSVPNPTDAPAAQERFRKVVPVAANDVWAITRSSLTRWNGSTWTVIPAPQSTEDFNGLNALAIDGTGTPWVAATRYVYPDGLYSEVYRYSGGAWHEVALPSYSATPWITALAAVPGTGTVWGVGRSNNVAIAVRNP